MKGLLFNCQKKGHVPDFDWPQEAVVVKNPKGEHHMFAMARCRECGAYYSAKSDVPSPTGIVDTSGKIVA